MSVLELEIHDNKLTEMLLSLNARKLVNQKKMGVQLPDTPILKTT